MTAESDHPRGYLHSGQTGCYHQDGQPMPCEHSGQDAEFRRGRCWPEPRFQVQGERVTDRLTGLIWPLDAAPAEFPLSWQEALDFVRDMNARSHLGHHDWRLPNRRELRSLISHDTRRPALPADHPFRNLFPHWYWSATSCAGYPDHAWYVNMDGGRMFYGGKDQDFMVWPVRGVANSAVPCTGQVRCYDATGTEIPCDGSGQDGELRCGHPWPEARFQTRTEGVVDRLTGLQWRTTARLGTEPLSWQQALDAVAALNRDDPVGDWRLPGINELESLVDADRFSPALPKAHPFEQVQDIYWSSTTSLYQPDWAWALYMDKGAVGVGHKPFARFHAWAVKDAD